jgi:hypothetical protein
MDRWGTERTQTSSSVIPFYLLGWKAAMWYTIPDHYITYDNDIQSLQK